jgi:hypothetical protein
MYEVVLHYFPAIHFHSFIHSTCGLRVPNRSYLLLPRRNEKVYQVNFGSITQLADIMRGVCTVLYNARHADRGRRHIPLVRYFQSGSWAPFQWLPEALSQEKKGWGVKLQLLYTSEPKLRKRGAVHTLERFEDFTAGPTKNVIFWDVSPCGSCKYRRFWGT